MIRQTAKVYTPEQDDFSIVQGQIEMLQQQINLIQSQIVNLTRNFDKINDILEDVVDNVKDKLEKDVYVPLFKEVE